MIVAIVLLLFIIFFLDTNVSKVLRITNELVEKDEQLAKFKHQELIFEQKLAEKDSLYKQDAMVRLQLGKRLEQVLMDKEDALEQLELLRVSKQRTLNSYVYIVLIIHSYYRCN